MDPEQHVGERVLDLPPLVESDPANDPVGQAFTHQCVLDGPRLRVRAIEHGCGGLHVVSQGSTCRTGDEVSFLELVRRPEVGDLDPADTIGPEMLVLTVTVLSNHRRGGVENYLRGSIVLLELYGYRFRKIVLEVQDVPQIGATPFVDRLVRVADHAQVAMCFGEAANEQILR